MDPYHWGKQRAQPNPQTQPPSQLPQSPRQQPPPPPPPHQTSAASFPSQPLMPSSAFPSYPPQPYHALSHSHSHVRDSLVHPHSFQGVQNQLGVPIQQHPLPQLPHLHPHSLSQPQPHPSLHMTHQQMHHPHIPPPNQQQLHQPPPTSTAHHPSSHHHRPSHQLRSHHPQPPQQPISIQPPRRVSTSTIPSSQTQQMHDQQSQQQHMAQDAVNQQIPLSQSRLPHLQQPNPVQPLPQPPIPNPMHQQHPYHHQHPASHHRHHSSDVKPPLYDNAAHPYRISQPRQPYYHHYSANAPPLRQPPMPHPSQMYPPLTVQHDYARQQQSALPVAPSVAPPQPLPSQIHPQRQPTAQPSSQQPSSTQQQPQQPSSAQRQQQQSSQQPRSQSQQQQVQQSQERQERQKQQQQRQPTPPPQQSQQQQPQQPPPHSQQHSSQSQPPRHQRVTAPNSMQPQQLPSMMQMSSASTPLSHAQPSSQQQRREHQQSQSQQPSPNLQKQPLSQQQQQQSSQQQDQQSSAPPSRQIPPPGAQGMQMSDRRPTPGQLHPPSQPQTMHMGPAVPPPSSLQMQHMRVQRQMVPPPQPMEICADVPGMVSQQAKGASVTQLPSQRQQTIPKPTTQTMSARQPPLQLAKQSLTQHGAQHLSDQVQNSPEMSQPAVSMPDATRPPSQQPPTMRTERPPSTADEANEQGAGSRQLKVEDALAYLEQVKSQFADCPKVYNHFLDIMKEFKAQTIDTGEVIKRVSTLFQGHSKLILGFNTFLPPGYRIELRGDQVTGCITGFSSPGGVFMPLSSNGATVQTMRISQAVDHAGAVAQQVPPPPPPPQQMPMRSGHHMTGHHPSAPMPPLQMQQLVPPPIHAVPDRVYEREPVYPHHHNHKPMSDADPKVAVDSNGMPHQAPHHPAMAMQKVEQHMKPAAQNDNAAAALRGFSNPMQPSTTIQGKPVEFEQAVTYVNKIKSRFADDEAVYKDFLNILQTYQKDQKDIAEVNRQVSLLFRDHEDLLAEFSRFLPEQSMVPYARQQAYHSVPPDHSQNRPRSSQPVVKQQPILEASADLKPAPYSSSSTWKGKEKPSKAATGSGRGKVTKQTPSAGPVSGTSLRPGPRGKHSGEKKSRRCGNSIKRASAAEAKSAQAHAALSGGLPQNVGSAATPELEFFEELRGLLGPQGQRNYSEFIKCLSLFSQEIISGEELMRLADGLLGNRKPLTDAFSAFIDQTDPNSTQTAVQILRRAKASTSAGTSGSDEKGSVPPSVSAAVVRAHIRDLPSFGNLPPTSASVGSRSPKVNPRYKGKSLSEIAKEHGKPVGENGSYMTLPADIGSMQCSGMTADDRSVLNDIYILKGNTSGRSLIDDGLTKAGLVEFGKRPMKPYPGISGSKPPLPPIRSPVAEVLSSPRTVRSAPPSAPICIEDQRLEIELMIARAKSTIQKLDKLESGELQSSDLCAVDVKPIEMIYADVAVDVVEVLRVNPMRTAGVIAKRLRQRVKDWTESKGNLEKIWKSKRFSRRDPKSDVPRNWKRPEMVRDVIDEGKKRGESERRAKKFLSVDLVCEDKNLSLICDILWFAFEWEATDVEEADKGLEVIEQVYHLLQQACALSRKMYVDDYLYAYMRLIAETSTRVQFLLEVTKEEDQLRRYVDCAKDVLGGDATTLEYDDFCEKMFSGVEKWEEYLCDFPLICKRLAESALKLSRRHPALDLLEMARKSVKKALEEDEKGHSKAMEVEQEGAQARSGRSEACAGDESSTRCEMDIAKDDENAGERGRDAQGDHAMEDSDGTRLKSGCMVARESAEDKAFEELQKARRLVNDAEGYLFELKGSRYADAKDEARRKTLKLTFRHIGKSDACQFRQLNMEQDGTEKTVVSTLTRYLKRAKKRKLQHDMVHGGCGRAEDMDVYVVDALDVRVNERGGLMYVQGTEDFFMNGKFKRRKTANEASHRAAEAKRAVAIEV